MRAHPRSLAAALALVAIACSSPPQAAKGPLDRLTFPTAVAARGQDLLVVSTNFDLTYSETEGGSVLALPLSPTAAGGGVNIGSLGGELAVADATRCGLPQTLALVPSRSTNTLYRLTVGADGVPSCGQACGVPLRNDLADPYGVTVACGPHGPDRVFVSHLRTPDLAGYVTMFVLDDPDLGAWSSQVQVANVGPDPVRSFAYDETRDRVFFTSTSTGLHGLIRWYDLAGDCRIDRAQSDPLACPLAAVDTFTFVRGADPRGIALSNPVAGKPRRAYVAARVFDADAAITIGGRPSTDTGGVLLVLQLEEGPDGRVHPNLVNLVDVGIGASEVAVLPPRPASACSNPAGCGDLVALTAGDDGLVWIYDDEVGDMRKVFGRNPVTGAPEVGRYPYGLSVGAINPAQPSPIDDPDPTKPNCNRDAGTCARVYVGSFQDNWVSAIDVPLADPGSAAVVTTGGSPVRIGVAP